VNNSGLRWMMVSDMCYPSDVILCTWLRSDAEALGLREQSPGGLDVAR
jgi:hypothetical protein